MEYKTGNVTVMVSDFERAVSFYTQVLGFTLKNRYGNEWADVSAPGVNIGLHPDGGNARARGAALSIGFEVSSLDQAMQELRNKGVEFPQGVRDAGHLREAAFSDPDGTPLYLVEIKGG